MSRLTIISIIGAVILLAYIRLKFGKPISIDTPCCGSKRLDELLPLGAPTQSAPYGAINWGRVLQLGDKGAEVTAVQEYLKAAGYAVNVNGTFDNATDIAVKQVQDGLFSGATNFGQIHAILALKLGGDATREIINKFK